VPRRQTTPETALGAAVRELRVERGLSQEALGHAAGVHRNWIGGIERGERNPTFTSIVKVAAALNVSAAELVAAAERHL
jgi:transcriptional regulator with XRE-family HTH domain